MRKQEHSLRREEVLRLASLSTWLTRGQNGDTIRAGSGEMGRGQIIKNFPYLAGAFGLHLERLCKVIK